METTLTEINPKILEHFENPRNIGEIKNADGFAVIGDPRCGDQIKVWILIKDKTITDFKYKVFGCWGAISTTSVVSELAIGKTINEAYRISDDDVIRELGGIPENKQHCSLLGIQGLQAAIAEYLINDNHKKYSERIKLYRSKGYDIPKLRKKIVKYIDGFPFNATILDIGMGKGHLALAIAKSGRKCTSIDISSEEIYMAQLNALFFQIDDRINFETGDASHLKFESNIFDVVLSADLMHHLIEPEPVLHEMLRVCKPDGWIIISDLNEKGKQIVAQVQEENGKEHKIIGWPLKKVQQWFDSQKCKVINHQEDCEDILIIN